MMSKDFVMLLLLFNDAMRSEVARWGYFTASTWVPSFSTVFELFRWNSERGKNIGKLLGGQ
jgi:hypothetical protein